MKETSKISVVASLIFRIVLMSIPYIIPNALSAQSHTSSYYVVNIGQTKISLPTPKGFSVVTPDMRNLYEYQLHFVPESNTQLAYYIPSSQIPLASKGASFVTPRSFRVQVPKQYETNTYSAAELFPQLKSYLKKNHDDLIKSVEAKLPGLVSKANGELTNSLKVNPNFAVSSVVPVGIYEESNDYLITSMYAKYSSDNKEGETVPYIASMTLTMLKVKDKIFFIYCYGDEKDLEWTREMSTEWAKTIHTKNLNTHNPK